MKITVDTNILLRAILDDDPAQAAQARAVLEEATLIAVPVPVLCELVWTMRRQYKYQPHEVAESVEAILRIDTVVTDRPAVEAGVDILRAGGDFADGAIACQGAALGGETLVTFDRSAIHLLTSARLLAQLPQPSAAS